MEKIDFCKAEKVKGEENQMEEKKINQQSRVAESEIIIDSAQPYRENYQMRMLKNNRIPGLLRVSDVEWKAQVDIIIIQDIHSRWKRIIKIKISEQKRY